jgi:hypothetical protein
MSEERDKRDRSLIVFWGTVLLAFFIALLIWWVLYQYDQKPGQLYGLGFWVPNDRPGWLPVHSPYGPLVGKHYFGDFFQLYYAVRSHAPYSNPISHTAINPGYLIPLAMVAWLPYPAGGFVYMGALLAAWIAPAVAIARRSVVMAGFYLFAATMSVPGLLALDIGQPEIFVYALAVAAFHQLTRRPGLSVVLIGVATAIKPYMALFLALYLFRREYRLAVWALLIGIVLNVATAIYLVHRAVLTVHLWSTIIHASLGYGSGRALVGWHQAPFLRSNASLFGLFYTLGASHVQGLSGIGHALADHYSIFSMSILVVGLILIWRLHRRMTLEVQWLYLAVLFLLVPSYTIGYAWLLLLVPFVSGALGAQEEPIDGTRRFGLLESRVVFIAVALSIAPYPANIALPSPLSNMDPAFGPNGNTIMTPLLLVFIIVLLVKNASSPPSGLRQLQKSIRQADQSRKSRHSAKPVPAGSFLQGLDYDFGAAFIAVIVTQAAGVLVAFLLSASPPL